MSHECPECGQVCHCSPGAVVRTACIHLCGPAALPDEFPNDGDDAEHDFTEEDLVS